MIFIAYLMAFFSKPLATRKDRNGRIINLVNYIKGHDAYRASVLSEGSKSQDSAISKAYSANYYSEEEDSGESEINSRIFNGFLSNDIVFNYDSSSILGSEPEIIQSSGGPSENRKSGNT